MQQTLINELKDEARTKIAKTPALARLSKRNQSKLVNAMLRAWIVEANSQRRAMEAAPIFRG